MIGWKLRYREKFVLVGVVSVCLAAMILCTMGYRAVWLRYAMLATTLLLIAALVSAVYDWHRFSVQHGVVVSETTAYKGNSTSYEPAFVQPLNEGVEFTVRETRDDWLWIVLDEGQEGWIPKSRATLY